MKRPRLLLKVELAGLKEARWRYMMGGSTCVIIEMVLFFLSRNATER